MKITNNVLHDVLEEFFFFFVQDFLLTLFLKGCLSIQLKTFFSI